MKLEIHWNMLNFLVFQGLKYFSQISAEFSYKCKENIIINLENLKAPATSKVQKSTQKVMFLIVWCIKTNFLPKNRCSQRHFTVNPFIVNSIQAQLNNFVHAVNIPVSPRRRWKHFSSAKEPNEPALITTENSDRVDPEAAVNLPRYNLSVVARQGALLVNIN